MNPPNRYDLDKLNNDADRAEAILSGILAKLQSDGVVSGKIHKALGHFEGGGTYVAAAVDLYDGFVLEVSKVVLEDDR